MFFTTPQVGAQFRVLTRLRTAQGGVADTIVQFDPATKMFSVDGYPVVISNLIPRASQRDQELTCTGSYMETLN